MSEIRGEDEKRRPRPHIVDAPNNEENSKSPPPPPPPPPLPPPPPPPPQHPTRPTPVLLKDKYKGRIGKPKQHEAASIHYEIPIRRSSTITIERVSAGLASDSFFLSFSAPTAVAIGPYHHAPLLSGMEAAKLKALDEFFQHVTDRSREWVRQRFLHFAETIRKCYVISDEKLTSLDDGELTDMMLRDGCFLLLQFMNKVSPIPKWSSNNESGRSKWNDDLVNSRMGAIARDVLLLENQIPWFILQELMELGGLDRKNTKKFVRRFLDEMATAFEVGSRHTSSKKKKKKKKKKKWWWRRSREEEAQEEEEEEQEEEEEEEEEGMDEEEGGDAPHHLLGLFHRHQLGKARTKEASLYILPSLGSTAVELAEMGVKLTASKTKKFGDMFMKKRRWALGLFGELSLAPLVLNDLTACWLLNIVEYEAFLGATQADNFAVSSYVFLVAHLVNRVEDVQDLRARGIISSAMSDGDTLRFFKSAAPSLRIGDRYIKISQQIQEYKQERWIWIAIHRFFYNNIKIIAAVLSVAGVLIGLFKTILSLRQPHQ